MELKRDLALPGTSAERKVYIVEGFILARPGTCPGRAIALLLGGDAAVHGCDLSLARRSTYSASLRGLPRPCGRDELKQKKPIPGDAHGQAALCRGRPGCSGLAHGEQLPQVLEKGGRERWGMFALRVLQFPPSKKGKRAFHQLQKHPHGGEWRGLCCDNPLA